MEGLEFRRVGEGLEGVRVLEEKKEKGRRRWNERKRVEGFK